jgi:hypothetical protein
MFYLAWIFGIICGWQSGDLRKNLWEKTHFIWDCGLVACCDQGADPLPLSFFEQEYSSIFPQQKYENIQKGDIVWLQCRFVSQFYHQILPFIEGPIVLVISVGDESFPSETGLSSEEIEEFLSSTKISHIFAQNSDLKTFHPKVTLLPIGLDYHTIAYKGPQGGWGEIGSPLEQEAKLQNLLKKLLPTSQRKKRAFVDFQFSDTLGGGEKKRYLQCGETRTTIFNFLQTTALIDSAPWMRRSDLWATKGLYAFSISPHGNGLDCHRTWEDLILGCIVITKTSSLDPLYEGLPVIIIQDWAEITEENLTKWLEQYKDAFTNPIYRARLTHEYWMNKIKTATSKFQVVEEQQYIGHSQNRN